MPWMAALIGRPSLETYDRAVFTPATFCGAPHTLREDRRALQSLIDTYFAVLHAAIISSASSKVTLNGFSMMTCLPALAAAITARW